MRKTPWAFTLLKVVALLLIASATYVAKEGTAGITPALRGVADSLAIRPSLYIYVAAVALALIELTERTVSLLQFRKDKVQAILDQMVLELFHNAPKSNRCSLLRAARGYRIIPTLLCRAIFWQEDKLLHLRSVLINPFGTYLYVWARAHGSRNHRSCIALRVYRSTRKRSQGIAGRVWEKDIFEIHDLPELQANAAEGVKRLSELPEDHAVVKYAKLSNLTDCAMLRARERYARHFYGSVIESPSHQSKWGILMVDSVQSTCPWPLSNRGPGPHRLKDFERDFKSFTLTLSIILT